MRILTGLIVGLLAADISGAWKLTFEKDLSGHPASHDCTFQQQGEKLTVTCDGGGKHLEGEIRDHRQRAPAAGSSPAA